ncbi:hypothetical protein ANO11243_080820 [Dothideomycetidae sp. 11243]|nr:hypothetical protein ANO11243_080820 [fungal sp. No.11243]
MSQSKKTVLVTGCSDGGLGAALSVAFHNAGWHVIATARDVTKMKNLQAQGIETQQLDVLSDSSIKECVGRVQHLDMLLNNAGGGYSMPISDLSIPQAKQLFDLNVWSYIAVTQAFLPLLLRSKGTIVNNTSVAGLMTMPFQAAYNASKAAMINFSDSMRLELEPFGVNVVNLLTGGVNSNFFQNATKNTGSRLPKGSLYEPAKDAVEKLMSGEPLVQGNPSASDWARQVVNDLVRPRPPMNIWRGGSAFMVRLASFLPFGTTDGMIKKLVGLDVVAKSIQV